MHHAGDLCRHICSETPFNSLENETCQHSNHGGFLTYRPVDYVTYIKFYNIYKTHFIVQIMTFAQDTKTIVNQYDKKDIVLYVWLYGTLYYKI